MVRLAGTRDILKATNVTMKVLHTVYCCFQTNQVEVAQTLCLAPEQLTNEQRHLHFQVPIIKKHHINGDVPSKTKATVSLWYSGQQQHGLLLLRERKG